MISELRARVLEHRSRLTAEEVSICSHQVVDVFHSSMKKRGFDLEGNIALYRGNPSELQLAPLEQSLIRSGARVYYPRVIQPKLGQMLMCEASMADPNHWKMGWAGLIEPNDQRPSVPPEQLDVIFVPGVVFGPLGERMGMGKGFYDRYLVRAKRALRISLAYDFQIQPSWQEESWDQRVDWIITEKQEVFTERAALWFNQR